MDDMLFARAHRIAEDTLGPNLVPTSAFDRFIRGQDQRHASSQKGRHQQGDQEAADQQARPFDAIKDAMIALKLAFRAQAHDPQNGGHGAARWRQDGSNDQRLDPFPQPLTKRLGKGLQDLYNLGRQDKHGSAPFIRCASLPCLGVCV